MSDDDNACRGRSLESARAGEAPARGNTPPGQRKRSRPAAEPGLKPALAELQSLFQRAILDGDEGVLSVIADSSRVDREVLFGVYRHAYRARLFEILRSDFDHLARVAGDPLFAELAFGYIESHPSRTQNARWYADRFPDYVARQPSHDARPELADIARLMHALNDAFDAADGTRLTLQDLARVPPAMWGGLTFSPHPSVRRLDLATNAIDLWRWARDGTPGEDRPGVVIASEPVLVAVYRPELTPRVRTLSYEEAMMFDELCKGVSFSGLCEMVSVYGGEADAPLRAATHLKVWIEQGMLSGPETD
ncbi:MAG: DNA-binding domain-containing protein [Hyphomicrobiaceae bacterium]